MFRVSAVGVVRFILVVLVRLFLLCTGLFGVCVLRVFDLSCVYEVGVF